ncbi:MAG: hypothetical protein J6N49_03095 [Alphaproteobacteria bacterium]|nr:hypothetical protein [Alphaproteobacteria bacterium]
MDFDFALFKQIIDTPTADDKNVAARFYDKAVKTSEVAANGLPVFKNVTYVEIRLKDNSTEVFNQPASAEKIRRFPREYALYKMSKEQIKNGTPLEQFAFMTAAEVATCKSRGVFTVEALAGLSTEKVKDLGLQNEYELARIFLNNAKNNSAVAAFAHREEAYKQRIEALQERINVLQSALDVQQSKKKRLKKGDKDENNS